jgi:hypothetical protein
MAVTGVGARAYLSNALFQIQNPRVHRLTLLEGRAQGAMKAVFEVQLAAPSDHMSEQVTVEGGVLFEQCLQIQRPLRGDELVQAHLVRCNGSPLLLHVAMVGVRAYVTNALENHWNTLIKIHRHAEHGDVTI